MAGFLLCGGPGAEEAEGRNAPGPLACGEGALNHQSPDRISAFATRHIRTGSEGFVGMTYTACEARVMLTAQRWFHTRGSLVCLLGGCVVTSRRRGLKVRRGNCS